MTPARCGSVIYKSTIDSLHSIAPWYWRSCVRSPMCDRVDATRLQLFRQYDRCDRCPNGREIENDADSAEPRFACLLADHIRQSAAEPNGSGICSGDARNHDEP